MTGEWQRWSEKTGNIQTLSWCTLNKQKKDPRIRYKKGSIRGLGENNLQAGFYRRF